jgi:ATP-dependent DNA helicase RecG
MKHLGEFGLEAIVYPDETLHEIVKNAVLHCDYSIVADIQIRVFDNRIEVESPGRLPGHVTPQNILATQAARNPKLVRLINKFPDPPNKDVGEGLNTAFEAMTKLRLKTPEIVEGPASVPMAYAIMGGLAVATVVTLVFLPALYVAWFQISPPADTRVAEQASEPGLVLKGAAAE